MDSLRRFLAIVRADLLERMRSSRFWLIIAVASGVIWWCFPPQSAPYMVLGINGSARAAYSSAWVGLMIAMLSIWVSLVGFYMVRGTLRRDIDSRVWELLAVTRLSRAAYLLAKWCSHMTVFGLIVAIELLVGLLAQWVRAEDRSLDLMELVKPALYLALPSLGITAMFALWFDLIPWLRRTAGNVLYLFIWIVLLIAGGIGAGTAVRTADNPVRLGDPRGIIFFKQALDQQFSVPRHAKDSARVCLFCKNNAAAGETGERFAWTGLQTDGTSALSRLWWLLLAMGGVLACTPFLDKAAAHTNKKGGSHADSGAGRRMKWLDAVLRPLQGSARGTMLAAELRLTLRSRHSWWWLLMLLALAVQLLAPPATAALGLSASLILMLDVYSRAALRDHEFHTASIIFSASNAVANIRRVRTLALLLLAVSFSLPALLHFGVTAPLVALATLLTVLAVASWGLALAALTRNSRTFEFLICLLAWLGTEGLPVLNPVVNPGLTVLIHAISLPLAIALFHLSWPRLYKTLA